MRTDVLTRDEIQSILSADFVCAWTDTRLDPTAGGSWRHAPGTDPPKCAEADGEHNTQMCVYTADGRLLNIRAGFLDAKDLARELTWARDVARPIAEDAKASPEKRLKRLQAAARGKVNASGGGAEGLDAAWLWHHVDEAWELLDVTQLVAGRGFGDHFFGKYESDTPAGTLGAASRARREEVESRRPTARKRPVRRRLSEPVESVGSKSYD